MKFTCLLGLIVLTMSATGCAGNQAGLQAEIDRLKQENQALKGENAELSAKIEKLGKPNPAEEIETPEVTTSSIPKVHITIQSDGSITVEGEQVTMEALPIRLTKVYQADKKTQVVMRTEEGVPYQRVVEVLDVVSAIGFDRLAMDTDGEK
jgi:biopolymer transport protein ExbD